jgi:hypothetical protein
MPDVGDTVFLNDEGKDGVTRRKTTVVLLVGEEHIA